MKTRTESKFEGITVAVSDFKERDKLLRVVTPDGLKGLILKGVKSDKAKLRFAASLFCRCEYFAVGEGDLLQVTGAGLLDANFGIATDMKKYAAASVAAEAIAKCCEDGADTKEEFLLLNSALKIIDAGAEEPLAVVLYVLDALLNIEGVDIEDFTLNRRIKDVLRLFRDCDFQSAVTADVDLPTVADAIRSLSRIFLSGLGIRLSAVPPAVAAYPLQTL